MNIIFRIPNCKNLNEKVYIGFSSLFHYLFYLLMIQTHMQLVTEPAIYTSC